jgi:hypothetical protein
MGRSRKLPYSARCLFPLWCIPENSPTPPRALDLVVNSRKHPCSVRVIMARAWDLVVHSRKLGCSCQHGTAGLPTRRRLTACWHERDALTDRDENWTGAGTDNQTASRSVSHRGRRINNPPQDAILHHKGRGNRPSRGVFESASQGPRHPAEWGSFRECAKTKRCRLSSLSVSATRSCEQVVNLRRMLIRPTLSDIERLAS